MDKYTSLELSKKLAEGGCELGSSWWWNEFIYDDNPQHWPSHIKPKNEFRLENNRLFGVYRKDVYQGKEQYYSAYDILNDICVKHAKEFFGDNNADITSIIFEMIREVDNPQSKMIAEEYMWEHCLFNKNRR